MNRPLLKTGAGLALLAAVTFVCVALLGWWSAPEVDVSFPSYQAANTGYARTGEHFAAIDRGAVLYSTTTIDNHGFPVCDEGRFVLTVPWPMISHDGDRFVFDCSGADKQLDTAR